MNIHELFELLGLDDKPDPWQYIDGLIDNSTLEEHIKAEMHEYNNKDTSPEIMEMMLQLLFNSQPDRIAHGMNYNMRDIHNNLKKL